MTKTSPQWWYSLIWASPRPESAERVNVGLLLGNGKPTRVEYLPDLPRLTGLVAPDELQVFVAIMESLQQAVASGIELTRLRQVAGPQLRIAEPKHLYVEPNEVIVRSLVRGLLESPRLQATRDEAQVARTQSEHD